MKINSLDRKKLIIILANYAIGAIIGIVLFYAQMRGAGAEFSEDIEFIPSLSVGSFLKTAWTNMLWIFSVFLFHSITSCVSAHPIMAVRGIVDTFCAMYLLNSFGIKVALASELGQCFSILPGLSIFTLSILKRRKNAVLAGREPCTIKRRDAAIFFMISLLAACVEAVFFKLICAILF